MSLLALLVPGVRMGGGLTAVVTVPGPYCVNARQAYAAGMVAIAAYVPGSAAARAFVAGATATDNYTAGQVAAAAYIAGAQAAQGGCCECN